MFQIRLKDELELCILSGYVVMGLFSEMDRLPAIGALALAALLAIEFLIKDVHTKPVIAQKKKNKPDPQVAANLLGKPTLQNILFGFLILIPCTVFWLAQWTAEFPFSGDHDHHVFAAVAGREYWARLFWLPFVWAGLVFYVAKTKPLRFWSVGCLIVLWILSSYFQDPAYYFSRYPAFGYLIAAPFIALADLLKWPNLVFANQTAQFLSLPIWLFALRPLLLKRWPDWQLLPFALFAYWQKDFLYYQTAAYLEPWSLVFIALSLEMLVTTSEARHRPLLMIAIATWFKETSILFAPFVWLAIYGPLIWRKQKGTFRESVLVGVAAVVPFIAYYVMRVQDKIFRNTDNAEFSKVFTAERISEFFYQIFKQWQVGGLLVLIAAACAWVLWFKKKSQQRPIALFLLAGALLPIPFYFIDAIALDFPGYPRFYLPTFMILAAPLFLLHDLYPVDKKPALFTFIVLVSMQFSSLKTPLLNLFQPSSERSFTEHHDSPAYFPIRYLIKSAEDEKLLGNGDKIAILASIPNFYPQSFAAGYRDFGQKYRFAVAQMPPQGSACACRGEFRALLVPLVVSVELKARRPKDSNAEALINNCVASLKQTCSHIFEQKLADGQLAGILGVNP